MTDIRKQITDKTIEVKLIQDEIDAIKKVPLDKRNNIEMDKYIKAKNELIEILKQLTARETDIEDDIKNNIPAEQSSIKARVKVLAADKLKLESDIKTDESDLIISENAINSDRGELDTMKENMRVNLLGQQKVDQENFKYAKLYEEGLKQANPNRLTLEQQPNESSDDYIKRIQSTEDEKFD